MKPLLPVLLGGLLLLSACQARTEEPPPQPRLLVSDMQGGALFSLDPQPRGAKARAVPMPGAPTEMVAGGGRVAVALLGRPYLELLQVPSLDEVRRIQLGRGCSGLALDEAGTVLAAACPEGGEVVLVPLEGGEPRRVSLEGEPYHLAWRGRRLLVTNPGRGSLQWVDADSARREAEAPLGLGPRGLALSGDRVLVALYDDNALAVLPADRPGPVKRLPLEGGPCDVLATEGGALVSLSEEGAVAWLDLETGRTDRLPVGAGAAGMARSADGRSVFVCCEVEGDVAVVSLADRQVTGHLDLPMGAHPREALLVRP